MLAKPLVRIINNWLHDVGTGLWAACLLVIVVIYGEIAELASDAALLPAKQALSDVNWLIFWLLVAALVVITITGALRLAYWRAETPADELAAKRPALIGKHVAFLLVYGPGTALAWWLVTSGAQ